MNKRDQSIGLVQTWVDAVENGEGVLLVVESAQDRIDRAKFLVSLSAAILMGKPVYLFMPEGFKPARALIHTISAYGWYPPNASKAEIDAAAQEMLARIARRTENTSHA